MTNEVAILRAYAFASQGKYAEAEQILQSMPEALDTLSGADLLARIRFERGDEDAARHIWEQILRVDPANEAAMKALEALDNPVLCEECGDSFCRKWKYIIAAVLAILLGISFSIGKACRKDKPVQSQVAQQQVPVVIAEQTLEIAKINGKVLAGLRDGILTNMTDKTILVLSGGRGKYATDRIQELAVIADNLRMMSHIPLSRICLRLQDGSLESIRIQIFSSSIEGKELDLHDSNHRHISGGQ